MAYNGSKAYAGRGTQLLIGALTGSTGTEVFTLIGEVSETSLGELTLALEETTNFQSGVFIERTGTMIDPGTVTIRYNYIAGGTDPGQQALQAAQLTTSPFDFKVIFPVNKQISPAQATAGDAYTFSAIVTKVGGLTLRPKNVIEGSAELTITGARTFTAGS
jgi:hypothetical protein